MDVFSAFKNAIVTDWEIGQVVRNTRVGKRFETLRTLNAIVDESAQADGTTENAEQIGMDTLLYVRPGELPTTDAESLVADYLVKNATTGKFYQILTAGIGKNQEAGKIEHVELAIRQTGVVDE